MTLDFVRDLCSAVQVSGVEYILFTFQKTGKKGNEVLINTFEWLDDAIKPAAIQVLSQKIVDWKENKTETKIEIPSSQPKRKKKQ